MLVNGNQRPTLTPRQDVRGVTPDRRPQKITVCGDDEVDFPILRYSRHLREQFLGFLRADPINNGNRVRIQIFKVFLAHSPHFVSTGHWSLHFEVVVLPESVTATLKDARAYPT